MAFNFGLLNALTSRTKLSKIAFCKKFGFKYDNLTKWTYGTTPNPKNQQRLADALQVDVDFLNSNLDAVQMMARQAALMKWSMEHLQGEREVKDEHIHLFEQWINEKADRERTGTSSDSVATTTGTSPLERPVEAVPSEESTKSPEQKYSEVATEGDNS